MAESRTALWTVTAGVSALGMVAAASVAAGELSAGSLVLLVVFAGATAFTRIVPFLLVRDGEGDEVSVDEALVVVMLVALPSLGVLIASLAGTALAHAVRRRSAMKTIFNHGAHAFALSAGIGVHALLGGSEVGDRSLEGLLAAGAGAVAYSVTSSVLIGIVIAVASRSTFRSVATDGLGVDVVTTLLVVGWGLLAVGVTTHDAAAAALVVVPMGGSWLFRHSERQRASMRALFDAAVVVGEAVRHGTVAETLAGAADRVLGRTGSRLERRPPEHGQMAVEVPSRSGTRWLVAGAGHRWDHRRREDELLLGALAAIGEIAFENAALLDAAGRDPDTGLTSGPLLQDRLQLLLDEHAEAGTSLLVVRISRFDVVRRTLGPVAAHRELVEVARRLDALGGELRRSHGSGVLVGYLGGGDFALAVAGVAKAERSLGLARLVDRELARSVPVDGIELAVEAAIGVRTQAPTAGAPAPATQLLRDAVSGAARAAQRSGVRRIELVDPDAGDDGVVGLAVEARLRAAIARHELVVEYQPQVSMSSQRVVGAEALVRWCDPELGLLHPGEFVPLAEGSALIVDLDRYVLRRAVAQLARWSRRFGPDFTMAVNLSAAHLAEPDTAPFVVGLLDAAGIDPRRMTVEVTESSVLTEASAALATLEALAERDVGIAVDDFGTGYSSLLYLRDFPVGELKVDRSFVSRMIESGGDAAIVTAIIRLAHTLGLATVAEGVETEEQLAALRALGCDAGQGFLWGPAVGADEFERRWLVSPQDLAGEGTTEEPCGVVAGGGTSEPIGDDVLAYVVHELRSPLTTLDGFAYLATQDIDQLAEPGDLPLYLDRIRHSVRTLQGLIDALHDASSANLGGMALHMEPTDLDALVRATAEAMAPVLGSHPVRLDVVAGVEADVDPFRIEQVLRNLISNAAKFSAPDAPIEISMATAERRCQIAVRDHGTGVPLERRRELFRRFARLGAGAKGMGIGLHLARTIARRHGGDVTYQPPAEGDGSIFTLELPTVTTGAAGTVGEVTSAD